MTPVPSISVIVPTRNRPRRLEATIRCLRSQRIAPASYEIVIVDDGSVPRVRLKAGPAEPACTMLRTPNVERSAARNAGVAAASADRILFLDDDMLVGPEFVDAHVQALEEWPEALVVGAVRLPDDALATPFGRFRQALECRVVPSGRGLTSSAEFCTAQNLSMGKGVFRALGGFDPALVSSEDQDLALRHVARGGKVGFVPAADAIHADHALDVRSYCRRAEWGSRTLVPFIRRYPDLPVNRHRERINGPIRWGEESLGQTLKKLTKSTLALPPLTTVLFLVAGLVERVAGESRLLDRTYRLLLGLHLFRGHRRGLREHPPATPAAPSSGAGLGCSEAPPQLEMSSTRH